MFGTNELRWKYRNNNYTNRKNAQIDRRRKKKKKTFDVCNTHRRAIILCISELFIATKIITSQRSY